VIGDHGEDPAGNTLTPDYRNMSFTIPLDAQLPSGVKILDVKMGVWAVRSSGTGPDFDVTSNGGTDNNAITLSLVRYNDNLTSNSVAPNGICDVMANITPEIITANKGYAIDASINNSETFTLMVYSTPGGVPGSYIIVTPAQIEAATQYLEITPTPGVYTTGANYRVAVQVDVNYLRTTAAGGYLLIYFSPIRVQYSW
jgi:hypothetical protein